MPSALRMSGAYLQRYHDLVDRGASPIEVEQAWRLHCLTRAQADAEATPSIAGETAAPCAAPSVVQPPLPGGA